MPAYLLSFPFVIILFVSFLYLRISKNYRESRIYFLLSVRLLIIAYNLFIIYGDQFPFISRLTFYLTYSDAMLFSLLGPLFYIFLLEILNERPATSASNAKHLWPVLPGLMFYATFSSLPYPLKMESFYGNNCGILPDNLLYATETSGLIFYLVLSIIKINRYLFLHRQKMNPGSIRQLHIYSWFLHSSIALCIGYGILSIVTPHPVGIHMVIIFFLVIQTLIELLLVFCIQHRQINYVNERTGFSISAAHSSEKNQNGCSLMKSRLNNAAVKLDKIMKESKLYLNHDLDVELLVRQTGINSNQIKTSIKEKYSMTVPEYINMYRIEHAKNLLGDSTIKIDILAYECGYSTRSNFYRAFKNSTGYTPNEYRNNVLKTDL